MINDYGLRIFKKFVFHKLEIEWNESLFNVASILIKCCIENNQYNGLTFCYAR